MQQKPPPSVSLRGVTKSFNIFNRPADILIEALTGRVRHREFTAIKSIDLDMARGSVIGIMGRNGAGKSTLLKLIAGTLKPTNGEVHVKGRIAAILELGSGFHHDRTGRENLIIGGLCLGLSRQEVLSRFDEIVAFAELGDFIDQPFRTYSSGMQARLAFTLATSVEPEVLIVDEILSVGDIRFQRKSFARLEQFRDRGVTILFVSHDTQSIAQLTSRVVILDKGAIVYDGPSGAGISAYMKLMFHSPASATITAPVNPLADCEPENSYTDQAPEQNRADVASSVIENGDWQQSHDFRPELRFGSGEARIKDIWLEDSSCLRISEVHSGQPFAIAAKIVATHPVADASVGFRIVTVQGKDVYGTSTQLKNKRLSLGPEQDLIVRFINKTGLAPGSFFVTVAMARAGNIDFLDRRIDAIHFKVSGAFDGFASSLVDLSTHIDVVGLPRLSGQ